ncbi:hypothetical protein AB924_08235 [Listeria monocytogenes]|nr:hypothetical protein [Listeria monocytogenes]EAG7074047.1 hypothetical protein [Listeria monocytogenes]EJC6460156.1 hypothetical protein [Listeria monocytogenes]MCR58694.1 hypothetical protein [Listeria monocytogenes]
MTEIIKLMKAGVAGSKEQFYPETHVQGIVGLSEYVSGSIPLGVSSINGKTGEVKLDYSDVQAAREKHAHPNANTETAGFMSAEDKVRLDGLTETSGISEARANELIRNYTTGISLETIKEEV